MIRALAFLLTLATFAPVPPAALVPDAPLPLSLRAAGDSAGALDHTAPAPEVRHVPAADVVSAFAQGQPLLENIDYKIHASRREGPGQAEVHTRDTDVIYVLEGSATIVTGGTVVEPKDVAPDEIRGTAIAGGEARALRKGDVMVVPHHTPHWFRFVEAPLLYYVVKVTAPEGDRYDSRRLNSPNDLVYRSDGALYFTDPPFGLPKVFDDARKELPWSGVFRVKDGQVTLLTTELAGPNGLAFSPDERFLYVGNWDPARKVVMRYEVTPEGALTNGLVFFDMTQAPGEEAIDGIKVDRDGHVYVSGPGGLWILSPEGRHLGTIRTPELPANFAWGEADRRTLYLAARTGLYRLRLNVPGAAPPQPHLISEAR